MAWFLFMLNMGQLIAVNFIARHYGKILLAVAIGLGLMFLPAIGHADDDTAVDVFKCSKVAAAYSKNPFALPMKDLDDLRLCITWQMSQMQREARDAKEARAIERNFGAGRDGE